MGVKDRAAVLAFLNANKGDPNLDITSQRARLDSLADFFPVPPDTNCRTATLGGVPGEWVSAKGSRTDAALLYLHGGGYQTGSSKSHRHLAAAISEASGLAVFSADYRMAPEHPFPAAVDDGVSAYKGLLESGFQPAKLAVAGDSAGGGLAIATLITSRDSGFPMPACAVTISAWTDLTFSGESHTTRAKRDPMIVREGLDAAARSYLNGTGARNPKASPLFGDLKGLPPLLLQVGTEEVLFSDSAELKERAEELGIDVSFESWGGMIHVWHVFHPILSEGRDAILRIGSFLKAHVE